MSTHRSQRTGPRTVGPMTTVFTRIIDGEIPGTFVWRDDRCVAFMSINPMAHGHALVVPIEEIDHWIDAPGRPGRPPVRGDPGDRPRPARAFDCERVGVIIAGYEVPHTHVHVIPTNSMAELAFANAAAPSTPPSSRPRPRRSAPRCGRWAARGCEVRLSVGCDRAATQPRSRRDRRSISSGPLLRTLLTSVPTACTSSSVSGAGTSRSDSDSMSWLFGSSQVAHADCGQDHRHPVVDRRHRAVGRRRDDRGAVQPVGARAARPGRATPTTARPRPAARRRGG